jgi:Transcriptional regulator
MLVKKEIVKKTLHGAERMSAEKRRGKILEAAVRIFAEHGFNGTTTKQIALAAGISEASLFQHFKTKAELYAAILECKSRRVYDGVWLDEIRAYIEKNEDEKVFRAIAGKIYEHCQSNPNFIRLMLYTALEKHENAQPFRRRMLYPLFELLRNYIEKRIREGAFQECSAEAAAFAFISTQVYYAMGNTLFQSRMISIDEEEAVSGFVKLSLDGLRCGKPDKKAKKHDFCRDE